MKILTGSQQQTVATQTAESKTGKEATIAQQKGAAKPSQAADKVDFSASLTRGEQTEAGISDRKPATKQPRSSEKVELSAALIADSNIQQELQAKRVESIKARIEAGTYRVSSREIAEKMLTTFGF